MSARTADAQAHRILLDGQFTDWEEIDPLYEDVIGDQSVGALDFGNLWVTNDEDYLFLCFEVGTEILLQEGNEVRLYLDTDNDPSTGTAANGIGAEMYWTFGARTGRFYVGIYNYGIYQDDIAVIPAPSVTSARFEISLSREATPQGQNPLFQGDTLAIVLRDLGEGQDELPDQGTVIRYVFDDTPLEPLQPLTLQREDPDHLRVLTYNVHQDDFFESWAEGAYTRILNAIDPDIIAFQEIYDHNIWDTIDRVEMMLGGTWYGDKLGPDIIVASRYNFLATEEIGSNGAYLINLEADYNCQLLLIDCHLPSGQNNFDRQMEVDAVMAFIRDCQAGSGAMTLPDNSPILITGDMNFVGYSSQLNTLITGDIVYQGANGPAFDPDWDGSDFTDLTPRHTDTPMYYTWVDAPSNYAYSPSRIDLMVFSDYVMAAKTNFVLHTPEMAVDSLFANGLLATDTDIASDHKPVVSDFWLHLGAGVEPGQGHGAPHEFRLGQNYPNPFNPTTVLSYTLQVAGNVNLAVYDVHGREVAELVDGWRGAGVHEVTFDGTGLAAGIYLYRLTAGGTSGSGIQKGQATPTTIVGKMVLLK